MSLTKQQFDAGKVLFVRPIPREEMGIIAESQNCDDFVTGLRRHGFQLPLEVVEIHEKNGSVVFVGLFSFTSADRKLFSELSQVPQSESDNHTTQQNSSEKARAWCSKGYLPRIAKEFTRLAAWLSVAWG